MPSSVHLFPVIALPSVSHPHPTLWYLCLPLFLHSTRTQLVGGVYVPTEYYGIIFKDKGFTVYEYCIWNTKDLCLDPYMFFEVIEVDGQGPIQNLLLSLAYSLIFPFTETSLLGWDWPGFFSESKAKGLFLFSPPSVTSARRRWYLDKTLSFCSTSQRAVSL